MFEVDVVAVNLIGRIDDSVFLLQARAAAKRHSSTAQHGVPTDIAIFLNHNDGCALIACHDSSAESRSTRTGDDNIGHAVPLDSVLRSCFGLLSIPRPASQSCPNQGRRLS